MAVCARSCTGCSQHERDAGRVVVGSIRIPGVEPEADYCIDGGPTEARTPARIVQVGLVQDGSGTPRREGQEENQAVQNERNRDHILAGRRRLRE